MDLVLYVKDLLSQLVIEKVMECVLKPFSQVCILREGFSYVLKSLQILYFVLWNIMFPVTLTSVVEGCYVVPLLNSVCFALF